MKVIQGIIWGLTLSWQAFAWANHEVSDERLIQATAELSKQVVLSTQNASDAAKNQAFKQINQALITLGWIPQRNSSGGFIDASGEGWENQQMINLAAVIQKVLSAISSDSSDVAIYTGMISSAKIQILSQLQASCGKASYYSEKSVCMSRALTAINAQETMVDQETAKLAILNGCKVAPYYSERAVCFNTAIEATQSPELMAQIAGCKVISSDSSKSSCFIEALSQ